MLRSGALLCFEDTNGGTGRNRRSARSAGRLPGLMHTAGGFAPHFAPDCVTTQRLRRSTKRMTDMNEHRDDEALIEGTALDPDCFALFYRRHAPAILAYFAARTQEPEDAADLMAETMAAALLGAGRFRRSKGPAVAWLYGIARNKLVDSLRRGRVETTALSKLGVRRISLDDDALDRILDLAEVGRNPSALAVMAGLPDEQREAVLARILEERPYREIANEAECSEALIRQRVSRGLRSLKNLMESK